MPSPLAPLTEAQARRQLERLRWPDGVRCAFCRSERVSAIGGGRNGLYQCKACRAQFTVTVGTIMHRSHIPLRTWLLAAQLIAASKKGMSAMQLQRFLRLGSYKTAWHLAHRLRKAMQTPGTALRGIVEVDETFIGGKGQMATRTARQTPVVAMIARDGEAKAQAIRNRRTFTLMAAMRRAIDPVATLMTDEYHPYEKAAEGYAGHDTVNHSEEEYVRGRVHINTAESFFALLKRGMTGSFHHVSKKHLNRYCHEFAFRWTYREEEATIIANRLLGNGLRKKPLRLVELTGATKGGSDGNAVASA